MNESTAAGHVRLDPGAQRRAIIALGGNLGDRLSTTRTAMRDIAALDRVTLVAASSLYETPALTTSGIDDNAPRYLNAVVSVLTDRGPHELLAELRSIEDRHGRQREVRWGSRTLDLDLIDVEGVEIASETLELPHPRAWQRAFVLAPWHEIEPDAHIAGRGRIAELLSVARDRVDLFAEAHVDGCSRDDVTSDRGLPLIGPDSQASPPRAVRRAGAAHDARGGDPAAGGAEA